VIIVHKCLSLRLEMECGIVEITRLGIKLYVVVIRARVIDSTHLGITIS